MDMAKIRNTHKILLGKELKENVGWGLGIDERRISKLILKEKGVQMCTVFNCFRIGSSGRL
jgi:hypothetical protein